MGGTSESIQVSYGDDWSVSLLASQYAAGLAEVRRQGSTRYTIWRALVDAGVPVRGPSGKPLASLAATALHETALRAAGV